MAIYRNVNITFWTDTKVSDDFSPEDKYFMLYCLTNNYTNLCGCYEISIKQMARDTGYNEETIEKLLERFKNLHKVIFYNKENKELLIKNWYKYNWTKSEKLDKPLLKEIENIKTVEFKKIVADEYNKRDTVSIPYTYPMDTTVSVTVSDTVSDTEKKIDDDFQKVIDFYNNNIGQLTPYGLTILESYTDQLETDCIIYAMQKAVESNKRNIQYIKAILNNWVKAGIKTIVEAKDEEIEFKQRKEPKEETLEEQVARYKKEWGLTDED